VAGEIFFCLFPKALKRTVMKKTIQKINFLVLLLAGIFSETFTQAQWISKASNILRPRYGLLELIAVGDKVAWGIGGDAFNPVWEVPASSDFTRTTDGGNHWTAGNVVAFPGYTLVGIAPLSATLCYGSLANFDNGNTKVVKTTDGGVTWTEQFNYDFGEAFSFFADIYFFNENEGLIFGDPSDDGCMTIFTTQDGGNHWTRVPDANMPMALADEFSYVFSSEGIGSIFWTVSTSGRVWKSLDKGLHWAAYETNQANIEFSNLKMRDELHGLWSVHGELYRTSDGAITWEEVETTGTWFTNDLCYVPGTVSTFVSTGAHDFPGYAENGSLNGIGSSYSVDDGNTWITIDTAVEHFCVAMVNSYTGFTGGINTNPAKGIFKYNGPALGYSYANNLTVMCHKEATIFVSNASIANHLSHGDALGACSSAPGTLSNRSFVVNETIQIKPTYQLKNFPNPFSQFTTITYSAPQPGKVSLKIYDVMGRQIKTLVNNEVAAGTYNIHWNVNDEKGNAVPAGIYLLRLNTGGYSETKKLSVIK